MSIIFEGVEIPTACCFVDGEHSVFAHFEYCRFYNVCKQRETVKTNYKPSNCPVKALEQEPRKGHWISHREHCEMNNLRPSGLGSYFWCSECDCGIDSKNFSRVNYNYCPNCGAKMESEE